MADKKVQLFRKGANVRIAAISTPIYRLPPQGYSGLEFLVGEMSIIWAQMGHQVTTVCPEGSELPGVEVIPIPLRCQEEQAYNIYKERLENEPWDVIWDSTWQAWPYASSIGRDPQLPIVHTFHAYPQVYGSPPPVSFPCFVGLSEDHCEHIVNHLKVSARRVYNGIDLDFYKPDPNIKRGNRYLALGRFTPEKGMLEAIDMARRLRFNLDCVGDTEIVGSQDYVNRCRSRCDGRQVRFVGGVSREETLEYFRRGKALLFPLQWREPFGLVPMEAMACGMPVLTLKKGSMPEVVKHGRTGFVVNTLEDMEQLIESDKLASIKAEDCRRWASKFTLRRMAESYIKLFNEVMAGGLW